MKGRTGVATLAVLVAGALAAPSVAQANHGCATGGKTVARSSVSRAYVSGTYRGEDSVIACSRVHRNTYRLNHGSKYGTFVGNVRVGRDTAQYSVVYKTPDGAVTYFAQRSLRTGKVFEQRFIGAVGNA